MAKTLKTPSFVRASTRGQVKTKLRLAGQSTAMMMLAEGKTARRTTPRKVLQTIGRLPKDRDAVQLIVASNEDRVAGLVPVRHTRMLESPFTFYRGTAGVQAYDLAHAPSSGIEVQCCGDAHLMNFGGFATPERNFIFDLNDFDEAYPAPFEWDVKRLSASLVLAARWRGFSNSAARDIAEAAARAYRERIAISAREATLDTWYAAITWEGIRDQVATDARMLHSIDSMVAKAQTRTGENIFHRLTKTEGGEPRLVDQPPLLYHLPDTDLSSVARPFLDSYAETLREDIRSLFSRLRFVDAALKVVGVGSVGTRCLVVLMLGEQNEPLFLQVKEARASVLAPTSQPPRWANNGERVVVGQRVMQAASDIFLGWSRGPGGRDFYVRQLRDMKMSVDITNMRPVGLNFYGMLCAQTLARAHAKAGGATRIAGYLGRSETFDAAIGRYALAYADQAEKDYEAFRRAAGAGVIRTEGTTEPEQLVIA